MRRTNSISACLLVVLVWLTACQAIAAEGRRDGNWWGTQTQLSKLNYVVGFFDGMGLGGNFGMWAFLPAKQAGDESAYSKASKSVSDYQSKYFSGLVNGQLADGLDLFYSDYRNRSIKVSVAVWLVVQMIAGEPPSEAVLNNWRRNAKSD